MLRLLRVFAPLVLALAAGSAPASQMPWNGTFSLEFGTIPPIVAQGSGVATVNGSATLGHLQTLRIDGGITNATTIPLTDPEATTLISLRATASLGTGTISGISGGPPLAGNVLPVRGTVRICLIIPGCSIHLPVVLTVSGSKGVGIGGRITVNTFSTGGGLKVSLEASPWTLGVASITGIPTPDGGTSTVSGQGFVHGPGEPFGEVLAVTREAGEQHGCVGRLPTTDREALGANLVGGVLVGRRHRHLLGEPGGLGLQGCVNPCMSRGWNFG